MRGAEAAAGAPLLRSPPLIGGDAAVSRPGRADAASPPDPADVDRIFAAIREARVGGQFWERPVDAGGATSIIRARSAADAHRLLADEDAASCCVVLEAGEPGTLPCPTIVGEVDPWSLLKPGLRLVAAGDDEWVAVAHIAGCPARIVAPGRFGVPGDDPEAIRARVAAHLLACAYRDPFTGEPAGIDDTIRTLATWRTVLEANRGIVAACGIAWWKRREIRRFLQAPGQRLKIVRSEAAAIRHAARVGGSVAVWPSRISAGMPAAAAAAGVPLVRVEDGFVRSVGLGSNLVPPSSVTVDRRGIHYDPAGPSDLEALLAQAAFPPSLLDRAEALRRTIVAAGISKYGAQPAADLPARSSGCRLVLVAGQVEDDMSVRLGGAGLASNHELLRRARALEPDAEIWFRPHPDVDAGHRTGAVPDTQALALADHVVRGGSMAALLDRVDAVHVLTSLTGFEALLRGRAVTCHGVPFYAGWGLTRDLATVPARRGRQRTLAELTAAVLILYPRYLDPVSGLPCPPETVVRRMAEGAGHNRLAWVSRLRTVQGRLLARRR